SVGSVLWSSCFFFSSRRRHTRSYGDWSSDVCSSDLISKHLKVLERAGLIARGREAQWRPCRLEAGPLKDAAEWLEHYRRFWEQKIGRASCRERGEILGGGGLIKKK